MSILSRLKGLQNTKHYGAKRRSRHKDAQKKRAYKKAGKFFF